MPITLTNKQFQQFLAIVDECDTLRKRLNHNQQAKWTISPTSLDIDALHGKRIHERLSMLQTELYDSHYQDPFAR